MRRCGALLAAALLILLPSSAAAEPLEMFGSRLFVDVTVNGHAVRALLDSGAEMQVLDDDFAEEWALSVSGGAQAHGSGERDLVALRNLVVAGREYPVVRAAIDDGATAANLNVGTSILRDFIITTDLAQGAIWLEPRE